MTRRATILDFHDAARYHGLVKPEPVAEPMNRLIKRYPNRKLYDVEASRYVSLLDVAGLIRGGDTVEIVDHATGEDITAQTLTQVVAEEGKRGTSMLPTDLLHDLLRRSGELLDNRFVQLRHGVDELIGGSLGRLTRALHGSRSDDLHQLRDQLAQLDRTLSNILRERQDEGGNGTEN
jgi:polyhydroxyalkanoate synthesis repressor PhaR